MTSTSNSATTTGNTSASDSNTSSTAAARTAFLLARLGIGMTGRPGRPSPEGQILALSAKGAK